MRIRTIALVVAVAAAVALPTAASAHPQVSGTLHEFGEVVDYPMLFPIVDGASYTYFSDTFWADRSDGVHHATDIMAPKMTPIIAPVAGTIGFVNWTRDPNQPNWDRCCNLTLEHDDGWSTWYIHLNNDTPGTDDGQAWGIAPGIVQGVHVEAGTLLGWVGDSGNAENTGPHLHFELRDPEGTIVNPYQALRDATHVDWSVKCFGKRATLVGTDGDDVLTGTDGRDVIHGMGGNDTIEGLGGDDLICAGTGDDVVDGGDGNDKIRGQEGDDMLDGGEGDDVVRGGAHNDTLDGGPGNDRVYGDRNGDVLYGSDGDDLLIGGGSRDVIDPGDGSDQAFGRSGGDLFLSAPGTCAIEGGPGNDTVSYEPASGVVVDLSTGIGTGLGQDAISGVENVTGSPVADILNGDGRRNRIRGLDGDDLLDGKGGDDVLIGGSGSDEIDGGDGTDHCKVGPVMVNCEPAAD
ncbi:MAG: peptidoglycan DD-metalloendopeptidase family protein [Actinobacteria bacterium]|nr:peptidoglycan DD-metalloendopeptidase family protein [Actinomycetota bacterium]